MGLLLWAGKEGGEKVGKGGEGLNRSAPLLFVADVRPWHPIIHRNNSQIRVSLLRRAGWMLPFLRSMLLLLLERQSGCRCLEPVQGRNGSEPSLSLATTASLEASRCCSRNTAPASPRSCKNFPTTNAEKESYQFR